MPNPINWADYTPVPPKKSEVNWDDFTPINQSNSEKVASSANRFGNERTWGEAIKDTAVQLAEGVNTVAGAMPNLVAPDGRTAEFFRDNADFWRDKQSDTTKAKIKKADEAISTAGEDGVIAQIAEAAAQYFNDPVLAGRFVTTNLPSLIPGLGATKVTHAAALARGASAARAASLATTAGGTTNAALNAGGARGEAFEDIKQTLESQGYSREQAEQMALSDSRVAAAVGAVVGYFSGKTGLEGSIVGKAGAGGALRAGGRSALAELAGEQIEEVAPKLTTNYLASEYDDRSIGQDVGRTMVETAIGSGPGSIVAGGTTALNTRAQAIAKAEPSGDERVSQIDRATSQLTGTETPTGQATSWMRPEVRLAELDLLSQTRQLTEQEVTEAQAILERLDDEDMDEARLTPDTPQRTQPTDDPISEQPPDANTKVSPRVQELPDATANNVEFDSPGSAPAQAAVSASDEALTNFWTYAKKRGYGPEQIKKGTELWKALKADYEQAKANALPAPIDAPILPTADPAFEQIGAGPVAVTEPNSAPVLQNRDRSRAAAVAQMANIARKPDYMRLATSRTPEAGAPMVFAVGDDISKIPEGNEGRTDIAVMDDGQRVPFRYAVVNANQVEPSHFADGGRNPSFSTEAQSTLKALNNGRTAGLRAAYEQGHASEYKRELIADAAAHGVSVQAIERTPNPILVRVYSERSNTPNMAGKSQGRGLGMSPGELARQDAPLIDSSVLAIYQPGDLASADNRDFVRAMIGKLHQSGQDVASMMTAEGSLSPAGRQRIQAALMQAAYGDALLVGELFDNLDTDIKAIGESLKAVAGEWANMRDSARQGLINPEADITDNLLQAIHLVRKARRDGVSLYDLLNQTDLMTGEVPDALTIGAVRFFYPSPYLTRAAGREAIVSTLRDYTRTAMSTTAGADMFGHAVTPNDLLNGITKQGGLHEHDSTEKGSRGAHGSYVDGFSPDAARQRIEPYSDDQAGGGVDSDRPAFQQAEQQIDPSNQKAHSRNEPPSPDAIPRQRRATQGQTVGSNGTPIEAKSGFDLAHERLIYSTSGLSIPLTAGQRIVESAVADEIEQRIGQFAHQPTIVIRDSAEGVLPGATKTDGIAGAVHEGRIFLFLDQMGTRADVQETLFHELFHYGVRKIFTRDQFIREMRALYERDTWIKARADAWVKTQEGKAAAQYGGDEYARARGVDEALARLAEPNAGTYTRTGAFSRAVVNITRWLADLAQRVGFTQYAAKLRSIKNQEARELIQRVFRTLETQAAPERGGWTEGTEPAFSRNSIGGNEPTQPDSWQTNSWTRAKAKALELTSPESIDRLIYEFQDKYIDLKRLREHIKAIGGTITDLNDAYLGEELYHKRLAKRTEDFLGKELKPFMADMRRRDIKLEEFERYLHARHAPEANHALAERNPNRRMIDDGSTRAQEEVRKLELRLQKAAASGSATKAIEEALTEARAQASKWVGAQAFRGDEAQRMALSGMSDEEAKALIESFSPAIRAHMEALATEVDQMQAKTLDMLEKYGLIDKATLDGWRSAYRFYVPLHRDEAHADSDRHPIGQGFSIRGKGMHSRVGSNEKVTNILAHIAMQREAVITRGEKNNVVKKLYLMAAQNQDEDFWSIDNPPKIKTIDARTGFVRVGVDPTYKNLPHVVMVRIAGKDQAIVFNEHNPQAVRLAEAMKNLDVGDLHVVLGLAAKATRWFASVNTQYNPIFGLINFARDVQSGLLNLSTTKLSGKTKEVAANIPAAMVAIYRERRGKQARSAEWTRLWNEFQDVGGTTGYRDLYADAQDRARALQKDLASLDRGEISKAAHAVVDWLSHYNETMENSVRLASYKVALDQGMSKERAASLAKNLTVNFNRKGRQTREIGALYAFFNAAIQGTIRMAETLKGPLGKRIMYGGVLLGMTNALIGMTLMGGDDDDPDNWEKIPDFIKERSIIIPISHEDYISIPMPLGFHVLPNIGRLAVEFAIGGSEKTAGSQLGNLLQILTDAFNPLGGSQNLGQLAAPTVIDPVAALMQNRDWTGKPIYRENTNSLDPQPGHRMTKDSASTPSRVAAEAINKITGGTNYRPGAWSPTPDQLDYVIGQLTGGLGRELLKVNQTIASTITGDELPPYKVPLVGRLYGNTRGPAGQSEQFYANVKLLNEIENEYKGRLRNREDFDELRDSEPLVQLIGLGNNSESLLRKLRELRRSVIERKDPGYQDRVTQIDGQIGTVMARLNNQVAKTRRESGMQVRTDAHQ